MNQKVDLERVRNTLRELEDNIIIFLFGRARFKLNKKIYVPGEVETPNRKVSFFEFLFRGTEELHAKAGRYQDPEEHPFYDILPRSVVKRTITNVGTRKKTNFNSKLLKIYMDALPTICQIGDDDNTYGGAAIADINCLQNLSKRVHIGEQVAEAKYQQDTAGYNKLIRARNTVGIMEKLTNKKVEAKILERVKTKGARYHVNPKFIYDFYKKKVIPLTKKVEVEYFYQIAKKE